VCFIDTEDGTERLRGELAEAGVPALPGRLDRLALGSAGDVAVTLADGAVHRFDVVYAALGIDPSAQLAAGVGARLDEIGNIVTDAHGQTSVPHLYAAGDVVRALDQIGVAVGQAAIAATAIHNSLPRAAR
jgi:thioredoxin reductase (NADPH)